MKSGDVPAKKARKIDIKLFIPQWDYNECYFAWECKLVGDKRVNSQYSHLISEYVAEGIFRFIDGKYSAEVDNAGMLGYVLGGGVADIVRDINDSMQGSKRTRRLTDADHLKLTGPMGAFHDTYLSRHRRTSKSRVIQLNHLFLTFDFS